jgi:hypothetical protein
MLTFASRHPGPWTDRDKTHPHTDSRALNPAPKARPVLSSAEQDPSICAYHQSRSRATAVRKLRHYMRPTAARWAPPIVLAANPNNHA